MPRELINASSDWVQLLKDVHGNAIDTIVGLTHQIDCCVVHGEGDPLDLLERIASQLLDVKRRIEAVQVLR